jgi:8-oxo-dGTP diphosphatase
LPVAALALADQAGRLLLQQRLPGKRHGGLWEFPGGKVESGESPRSALIREIAEELDIGLAPADLVPGLLAEEGGDPAIVLFLYTCRQWSGEPSGVEGQAWGWFSRQEAEALPLAPMDRDLLSRLGG